MAFNPDPNPTIFGTHDNETGVKVRDVSPVLAALLLNDSTFLSRLAVGDPVANVKYEWPEERPNIFDFSHDGGGDNYMGSDEAESTLDVTAGHGLLLHEGWLFRSKTASKPEVMQVKTIATDVITVTRKYGGGVYSAHVAGEEYELIGPALPEGSAPQDNLVKGPVMKANYSQILGFDLGITDTQANSNIHGIADYMAHQVVNRTKEFKNKLARTLLYSKQHATTPEGGTSNVHTLNGLRALLTAAGGNVDSATTTMSETLINDLVDMLIVDGADPTEGDRVLLTNVANAHRIAKIWADKIRITQESTVRGNTVTRIVTELGAVLDVMWDAHMIGGEVMCVNFSKCSLHPYRNRALFIKPYDIGNDAKTLRLIGEWTFKVVDALYDHAIATAVTQ